MSNVDGMRDGYERYSKRDWTFLADLFDENIDWRIQGVVEVQGREGVQEFFNGLAEQFASHRIEMDDYVEDGDRLVAFVTHTITRHDGETGKVAAVHSWRFRDGKAVSLYEVADTMAFAQIAGMIPTPAAAEA